MNWFGDKTVPRGAELQKVARALGIGYSNLEAAYEGRDPEPQPLQDAIRDLVEAISALVGRLDVLTAGQATVAGEMMRALGVLGARPDLRETQPEDVRGVRGSTGR